MAHTAAMVETMKRVLRDGCVSIIRQFRGESRLWGTYKMEAEVSRFAFWLTSTKYAWYGQLRCEVMEYMKPCTHTSMPRVGISVTISHSRQKVKKM